MDTWMRYIDFSVLQKLYMLLCRYDRPLSAREVEDLAYREGLFVHDNGKIFPRTVAYHYRNTLEKLGLATVSNKLYQCNTAYKILSSPFSLTTEAQSHLASLIISNKDCQSVFFNYFIQAEDYDIVEFQEKGRFIKVYSPYNFNQEHWENLISVGLIPPSGYFITKRGNKHVPRIIQDINGDLHILSTPEMIQATLWGVRLWSIELGIIDEIMPAFDKGLTIYVVNPKENSTHDFFSIIKEYYLDNKHQSEWFLVSIPGFIEKAVYLTRYPVKVIKGFLESLLANWVQFVLPVTTSGFIVKQDTPFEKQEHALRNSLLYQVNRGYISHIRIHCDLLKEVRI